MNISNTDEVSTFYIVINSFPPETVASPRVLLKNKNNKGGGGEGIIV